MVFLIIGPGTLLAQATQWSNGSNGAISYNGGNVGIGTAAPATNLQVVGTGGTWATLGTGTSSGTLDLTGNNGSPWGYADISENATNSGGSWALRDNTREGWAIGFTSTNFNGGGIGFVHFAQGSATPATFLNITGTGNVGIGTTNPQYLLSVNGTIQAKEVLVNTGWADYVFQPEYRLKPLTEVAAFIKANHHLPGIPSEAEVKEKGVSVGEMQSKLLAKIEELTLLLIKVSEDNQKLETRVAQLEDR